MESRGSIWAGTILAVAVLLITLYLVLYSENNPFNVYIFYAIFRLTRINHVLNVFMIILAVYGREYFWIPVVAALWFLGNRQHRFAAYMISAAFIFDIILGTLMKDTLALQRPFLYLHITPIIPKPSDTSYPSGHALIVWSGAAMSMLTLSRRWSIPLSIEAFLVAFARVFVGVHWPLDVIGGGLLGVAISFILFGISRKHFTLTIFEYINRFIPGFGNYRQPELAVGKTEDK